MEKNELEKFEQLLKDKKVTLEGELRSIAKRKEGGAEGDWESNFPRFDNEENNPDSEDRADEVEEYINRLPVERALELDLKKTVKALERIQNGTYGKCEKCGKVISKKRLEAVPETTLCMDCANKS